MVNARTYGGHGEQMAVFASTTTVDSRALTDIIGIEELPDGEWEELKGRVYQRRQTHHRTPRSFFFAEPGIPIYRDDCGCYGWQAFPLAGWNIR